MTARTRSAWRPGNAVCGVAGLVGLFAVIDVAVRLDVIESTAFPAPGSVVRRAVELLGNASFRPEIWTTLWGSLLGLGFAIVIGVGLGALLTSSRVADRLSVGVIELLRPLPAVALAPLLLSVLGRGFTSRSIAVAFAAMWPILFNTVAGLRSSSTVSVDSARSMGLSSFAVLRRVRLPAAMPFVFTGVRVAASIALIVEVSVEILLPDGERAGLGGFIALNSIAGFGIEDREAVYGATLIAGLLGLIVAQSLEAIQDRSFAWAREESS